MVEPGSPSRRMDDGRGGGLVVRLGGLVVSAPIVWTPDLDGRAVACSPTSSLDANGLTAPGNRRHDRAFTWRSPPWIAGCRRGLRAYRDGRSGHLDAVASGPPGRAWALALPLAPFLWPFLPMGGGVALQHRAFMARAARCVVRRTFGQAGRLAKSLVCTLTVRHVRRCRTRRDRQRRACASHHPPQAISNPEDLSHGPSARYCWPDVSIP